MTREIEARLKVTGRDATGNMFSSLAAKMAQVNKAVGALNRQQHVLTRTAEASAAIITRYAAPAALAYGAKEAFMSFAEVERRMTRIGMTAGATKEETDAAFASLQRQAKDVSMTMDPAIVALDTLTASGMSLKEAMDFMPSVLATAQASGATTEDIANTAMKTASALGLQADQMQKAFDIMVTGGKLGQFELKDMAQYIPGLANSFATLGYKGEDGLKQLIAILQTIREDTGDASSAATQAQNIFGKMYSEDTAKKFSKFGINLRRELKIAEKNGEGAVEAFVRLSREALKGDLSKLPLLFTDQEFRLGMQSLITSAETLKRVIEELNSTKVEGTVARDVKRVTEDAQAAVDRLENSWEKLKTSFGAGIAPPAVYLMDKVSDSIDYGEAVRQGIDGVKDANWFERNIATSRERADEAAYLAGYGTPEWRYEHEVKTLRAVNGLDMPIPPEFPGGALKRDAKGRLVEFPIPTPRPEPPKPFSMDSIPAPRMLAPPSMDHLRSEARGWTDFREAMKIDMPDYRPLTEASQTIAQGGQEMGDALRESSGFIKVAGVDVISALNDLAGQLRATVAQVRGAASAGAAMGDRARPGVNANLGSTVPPLTP